ncbi:FtsX-like permease family protein [Kribbella deserti]|uniref:FtsX-like permease family protein n=1 Tax=Kribbella deserti TaxID=1926257 RepID=A0ABV6QLV6_9ACTN
MRMWELAIRFVRRPGQGGRAANLAAFGATAVVSLLITFLIAGSLGLVDRSDRIGWRASQADKGDPVVGKVYDVKDVANGTAILRLDLAVTNPSRNAGLQPPPGLPHTPKPGEVWVSPALAKLWRGDLGEQLSKRYHVPKPTGVISDAGLSSPDEQVVIRGVEPLADKESGTDLSTWRGTKMDDRIQILLWLVGFGLALVIFPVLSLVGQAAGVAAKRREHRLAALRLAGATRTQVLRLSAVEQAILAVAGAAVGLIAYTVLSPLIARIPLGGGRWYVSDLTVAPWLVLLVMVLVPVLSVLSAMIGLGRVSITPLGVTRGHTRKAVTPFRLVLLAAGPLLLAVVGGSATALVPIIIGIALGAFAVRIGGPFVLDRVGRILARTANSPSTLLAGRRLADDPKAAFRPVAALVLAGFVSGFLSVVMPFNLKGNGSDNAFEVAVHAPTAKAANELVATRIKDAGLHAQVQPGEAYGDKVQHVLVSFPKAEREQTRTALYDVSPDSVPITGAERDLFEAGMLLDLKIGVLLLLGVVFVTGAASTAAGAVGTALDQAGPAKALRRSGVPLKVIERSARLAAVLPVIVVGLPTIGMGAFCGLLANAGALPLGEGSAGAFLLAGQVIVGLVLVSVAGAAGAPVLRKASAN